MNAKHLITIFAVFAMLLTACATPTTEAPKPTAVLARFTAAPAPTSAPMPTAAPNANGSNNAPALRLVITDASMTLTVEDTALTIESILKMTARVNGYVVSIDTRQADYWIGKRTHARVAIRVPSEKFDSAMSEIKRLAMEVRDEKVIGIDVTDSYTDLRSRLANLESAERQLQKIMENAQKTEDVLNVYKQLVSTREEIERIKGRMKYYEDAAAMSSITMEVIPYIPPAPTQAPYPTPTSTPWKPDQTLKRSTDVSVSFLQMTADAVIGFTIVCGPFIVILGVPLFFIARYQRQRGKK